MGMESAMADELPDPNTRVAAVTPTRSRKPTSTSTPTPTPTPTANVPFLPRVPYIHAHPSYGSGSASTSDLPSGTSSSGDSLSAGAHPGDSTPKTAAEKKGRHPRTPKAGKRWNKSVDHTNLDTTPTTPNSAKRAPAGALRGEGATNSTEPRRSEGGMATTFGERPPGRGVSSPRPKGRGTGPNIWLERKYRKSLTVVLEAKNTFCRNVTIYGHCRYENTCPYIHDAAKLSTHANENMQKSRFTGDSPAFTPLQAATNGSLTPGARSAAISPKAAKAAVFTPKSQRSAVSTPSLHTKEPVAEWHPQEFQEFVPQGFGGEMVDPTPLTYDPFNTASTIAPTHHAQPNPYVQDPSGTSYYQTSTFQSQPAYHLYFPLGPSPQNLLAYQRTAHSFFIPTPLLEDLQKKSEVGRQILPNSTLPPIEQFHSLVCLDTTQHKASSVFGYPSWVYKAVSAKDGQTYALRRLEGFRLTNVDAMRGVKKWKSVLNGGVVTIHDAFTTRAFGDSSLIVVTDYHACSKSLVEEHFRGTGAMVPGRGSWNAGSAGRGVIGGGMGGVPEATLWGYIVQISSALKAIHSVGLAARLLTPSKILLTSKNRIRLNACAIMDVVSFSSTTSTPDLQAEDLLQLGRLILAIATGNMSAHLSMAKSVEQISRAYTARLRDTITWLLSPSSVLTANTNPTTPTSVTSPSQIAAPVTPTSPTTPVFPIAKDIDTFLAGISDQFALVFDSTLHAQDTLTSTLAKELESSRLVRLLVKLNMINERPELSQEPGSSGTTPASSAWAETGERYYLKLFRDYVFHQVDASGRPVTDLSHVLECLNKLDAGSDEKLALISRDEQNVLVVTYREVKRGLESAFQEVVKAGQQRR